MNIEAFSKTIEQKVIKFINYYNLINQGDKILVAISGGPDSVFLIYFLNKYKKKYQLELSAFHFNHLLRRQSFIEQEFSQKICKNLNIEFFTKNKNVKLYGQRNKISIEEAGRILRYDFLKVLLKKIYYNKIATGHNLNDNTETVLLNLFKGKGVRALSGIPIKYGPIIRPLLCLTKEEIIKYLNLNKIEYMVDSSNYDVVYERNFLRLNIIPQITEKINKNLNRTVFQSSKILADYLNFTENILEDKFKQFVQTIDGDLAITLNNFKNENNFIKTEIIRRILLNSLNLEPSFKIINDLLALVNKQSGRKVKILNSYEVYVDREILRFKKINSSIPVNIKINLGKIYRINNIKIIVSEVSNANLEVLSKSEFIDSQKIVGDLFIRNWKPGDKFIPLGMKNYKKISDFLTDIKVPSSKKKDVLLLTDNQNIIYLIGYRLDDRFKITNSTKKLYKIEIKDVR